jgi:hypothetical protein
VIERALTLDFIQDRHWRLTMRIRHLLLSLCGMELLAATALAADVAGRWEVLISTAEGPIRGVVSLKQAGDEVTGWVGRPAQDGWVGPSENDPIRLSGTVKKGKLVLKTRPQPGQTVAFDEVELSIKGDTMSGALERGSHGKGTTSS